MFAQKEPATLRPAQNEHRLSIKEYIEQLEPILRETGDAGRAYLKVLEKVDKKAAKVLLELAHNPLFPDFLKGLGEDGASGFARAIYIVAPDFYGNESDFTSLFANKEVANFASQLGPASKDFFVKMLAAKHKERFLSSRLLEVPEAIRKLEENAFDFFEALDRVEDWDILLSKSVVDAVGKLSARKRHMVLEYAKNAGSASLLAELPRQALEAIDKILDNDQILSELLYAIEQSPNPKETAAKLANEDMLAFINSLGYAGVGYLRSIGKNLDALTNPALIKSGSLIGKLNRNLMHMYFSAIANVPDAVEDLADCGFLRWLANQGESSYWLLPKLANVLKFSRQHGLYYDSASFENYYIIRLMNIEKSDFKKLEFDLEIWNRLLDSFSTLEELGIKLEKRDFEKMQKLVKAKGGSPVYLWLGAQAIVYMAKLPGTKFQDLADAYHILLSLDEERINGLIISSINQYLAHTFNLPIEKLPSSISEWGLDNLKLVLLNLEMFKSNPDLLRKDFHELVLTRADFFALSSILPNFGSMQEKRAYAIASRPDSEAWLEETIGKLASLLAKLFPSHTDASNLIKEIEGYMNKIEGIGGKELRAKLLYVRRNYLNSQNWSAFYNAWTSIRPSVESTKRINPKEYEEIAPAYLSVLSLLAGEHFRIQISKLMQELQDENKSKEEIISKAVKLLLAYITEVKKFGQGLEEVENEIINIKRELGEYFEGSLYFEPARRGLDIIFGGRYSGDCTAPSGEWFPANFGWASNPEASIINCYWKRAGEDEKVPVGRIYLFAVKINGKPGVIVDSIEFLESFVTSSRIEKALIQMLKDYSKFINVPLVIDALYSISNRTWVEGAVMNAGFEIKEVEIQKIGKHVSAEHVFSTPHKKKVFLIK
jgi:hypothetical protein